MSTDVLPTMMKVLDPETRTRDEITASLRAHNDLIFQFSKAWYASPYTFQATRVLGHVACKIPFDLWIMHDLFCQYRFQTVVECGTAEGGATLWYATLMDLLQIDGGHVYSIDIDDQPARPVHPRITYLHGSSLDRAIAASIPSRGATLINLDSNHVAGHVLAELELWAPRVPVGGWLVVEDTNGTPIVKDPATGQLVPVEGPYAAVMEYLAKHPGEFLRDVVCERYWLTMNPSGWLQRSAPCPS